MKLIDISRPRAGEFLNATTGATDLVIQPRAGESFFLNIKIL
jgi:hypothetical protein